MTTFESVKELSEATAAGTGSAEQIDRLVSTAVFGKDAEVRGVARFTLRTLAAKGFSPIVTPDLARNQILEGIGFTPRGTETQIYSVEDSDLSLIGTAEITLWKGFQRNHAAGLELLQADARSTR